MLKTVKNGCGIRVDPPPLFFQNSPIFPFFFWGSFPYTSGATWWPNFQILQVYCWSNLPGWIWFNGFTFVDWELLKNLCCNGTPWNILQKREILSKYWQASTRDQRGEASFHLTYFAKFLFDACALCTQKAIWDSSNFFRCGPSQSCRLKT